jgi:hypothetical protein
MSGERGLRWPQLVRAQLAPALLTAFVAALALVALRAAPELSSRAGGQAVASSPAPSLRATSGVLPQAALGPVSAVLGAAEPSYHVHAVSNGAHAINRGQGFAASFTAGGVKVSSGSLALAMRAAAAGFGASPAALAPSKPLIASNRVTYEHPGLQEWYANGPFGLEQGFTLDRPAAGAQRQGAYTVALVLSGTTPPLLTRHGRSLALRSHSGATLRYGGLRAVDAAGRLLPSWLSLRGRTLSLHVRTAGARFPVSIDPVLTGEGKIIELGQEVGEAPEKPAFGSSVALSGDGTTALVGAPAGESHTGAAWVFHREGAVWSQQGPKLSVKPPGEEGAPCEEDGEGSEPVSCAFGSSVSLSFDGSTALIGAPRSGSKAGVAWVFDRSGSSWSAGAELSGPEEAGQQAFGFSVALSSDGSHALVGAPTEHGGEGEAYLFERVESAWSNGVPLIAKGEGSSGHLGFSVALSGNGQHAIVGAPLDAGKKGTAFIFEHVGLSWAQNGNPLTGTGESGEGRFGESVAMSGDGSTALVGAPAENAKRGSVWTFVDLNTKWVEFGTRLTGIGNEKEEFGRGLALSGDGSHALIGAPRASSKKAGEQAGAAWLYEAEKSAWAIVQPALEASLVETGHGQFAKTVSMTENGQTLLVGAPHETFKAGAVWLFGQRPTVEEVKSPPESKEKAKGRLSGGNKVMIVGRNFEGVTAVWFGGAPHKAEIVERVGTVETGGQEKLLVAAPPGEEGADDCPFEHGAVACVPVTVETKDWLSAENTNDQYQYVLLPGEEEKGGGGGGGAKNKHHPNEIPFGQLNVPLSTVTGTNTGKGTNAVPPKKSTSSCRVYLRTSKISVATHARAMVSLVGRGSGRCGGRLTLQASVKKGHHTQVKTIASGTYVATAGHNLTVALRLGSTGQGLLHAGHGHLKARLLIGRTYPTALKASASNVTLSNAKKKA